MKIFEAKKNILNLIISLNIQVIKHFGQIGLHNFVLI